MKNEAGTEYDTSFFDSQAPGSRKSASVVVPLVDKLVGPTSVLDVGCGIGTWLAEWESRGITDVFGLDGEYVDNSAMQVPREKFRSLDLRNPFSLGRRFDLVECLEVAEHLEEQYADTFVESLASHADTILFSAAIPGQTGSHHVNEQWPSYWIAKFVGLGFMPFDVIRPRIWTDPHVEVWYRQNIMLFSRTLTFERFDDFVDVVHPDLWEFGNHSMRFILGNLRRAIVHNLRNGSPNSARRANMHSELDRLEEPPTKNARRL
jgi:SAM-dependent methyltransferase